MTNTENIHNSPCFDSTLNTAKNVTYSEMAQAVIDSTYSDCNIPVDLETTEATVCCRNCPATVTVKCVAKKTEKEWHETAVYDASNLTVEITEMSFDSCLKNPQLNIINEKTVNGEAI